MLWILEIVVVGFLLGMPALKFDGAYRDKFQTEKACNEFKSTDEVDQTGTRLIRIARQHLADASAKVVVTFECVQEGDPV